MGIRYDAIRGGGARKDGRTITPSGCTELSSAIVGISGYPGRHPGWAQFRTLGAARWSSVPWPRHARRLHGGGPSTLYGWDYLAGLFICPRSRRGRRRAREGRELIVREASTRRPVVAATSRLADRLLGDGAL